MCGLKGSQGDITQGGGGRWRLAPTLFWSCPTLTQFMPGSFITWRILNGNPWMNAAWNQLTQSRSINILLIYMLANPCAVTLANKMLTTARLSTELQQCVEGSSIVSSTLFPLCVKDLEGDARSTPPLYCTLGECPLTAEDLLRQAKMYLFLATSLQLNIINLDAHESIHWMVIVSPCTIPGVTDTLTWLGIAACSLSL